MKTFEKQRGHYMGTEIEERWWRRFRRDGFFARGSGDFWMDSSALHFHRKLTKRPIAIAFRDVTEVKVGKWHSGQWAGGKPVVKVLWRKGDERLSSGFVLSRDSEEAWRLAREIGERAGRPSVGRL